MLKIDELENPQSCLNKARMGERLFVLLARDEAAPVAIRAWAEERVRLLKNLPGDWQIKEALACADQMEKERHLYAKPAPKSAQPVNPTAGDNA